LRGDFIVTINQNPTGQVKVHNVCWAVYTAEDPKVQPIAELHRPQDWGDPRWMYRFYILAYFLNGEAHANHVHIWHEGHIPEYQLLSESAGLIAMSLEPGVAVELSGRDFLDQDDFWLDDWGKMPPYWDNPEDEDYVPMFDDELGPNPYSEGEAKNNINDDPNDIPF
jgi:hypothetical protein